MSDYSIGRRAFLTIISAMAVLTGCGPASPPEEGAADLDAQELFLVEQYLRVVEVRSLVIKGSPEADSLLAELAVEIPVDSVMGIAERISREHPDRMRVIFQEIERRIELLEP